MGTIDSDLNDIQERWDAISGVLHEVRDKIPKMKEAVPAYEEKVKSLEECLAEANDVLAKVEPCGLDVQKAEEQMTKLTVRFIPSVSLE